MVDYAKEYGIDLDALVTEGFGHPAAQWDNARIHDRGVEFWEWYRRTNLEAPTGPDNSKYSKARRPRQYSFTDEQMAIAMRSIRESR
jgi:hypothetical protein